jgi:hypothetical protein
VDLRKWGGPRQVALIPPGDNRATTDPATAKELARDKIGFLQAERGVVRAQAADEHLREKEASRRAKLHGLNRDAELRVYAAHHLAALERDRGTSEQWLDATALMLDPAIYFFDVHQVECATRDQREKHKGLQTPRNLAGIGTPDVEASSRGSARRKDGHGKRDGGTKSR